MSLSKMEKGPSLNRDIISDMPPNIIENILSHLPIKEAVQTCILSKKWRYNWVTLPELIFNFSLGHAALISQDKIERFIDGVLSLYRGPIYKFQLSSWPCIQDSSVIDKWILWVSRNDIQELILYHPMFDNYELPLCIYSCEHLNHLELSYCTLRRPPMFSSFQSLRSLLLEQVDCVGFTFENLISRCPLLERLKIEGLTSSSDIIIYGPKLKELVINGFCNVSQNICFKNTPVLACVSLNLHCYDFSPKNLNHDEMGKTLSVVKVFGCLVAVEKLDVGGNFLKFLGVDYVPKRLPNIFYRLKRLDLKICLNDLQMVSMAICLIRSAPNLQELLMNVFPHTYNITNHAKEFSQVQDGSECSLNQLQNVKIKYFSGLGTQIEFIKFLLIITPALEKMSIHGLEEISAGDHPMHGSRILEKLMQLPRVSMKAKIEYFEQ
ncbi:F-box/FBD/LRR-repeat protein At1g13570-like [Macadamia integrifolia]|uniref:F-box/FBD/LRR-repeat protein At1g13570-like n=1 Tax=Macadamia integrifolia TaxID=60698 RepID=UPI001C501CD1|nr:F-box/FBD/LRR-repeat protein At1g13570-like [Macadamia integrifolia]